ncbi:MAG TPA: PAS domain S-box protein [Candidatus Acidoferrales bacterium]|nr:PAS domain S-box protein [Candidatus Acidoferrales bacterium]
MPSAQQSAIDWLFQQLLEGNNDLLAYEIDSKERFIYVSPSIRSLLGIAPESALGQHPQDLGFQFAEDVSSRSVENSQKIFSITARHSLGHTVELEVVESRSTVDGEVRTFSVARDITQRKDTERQLRLADEILRSVDTLVLVVNGDGLVVYGSPSITRILGYANEEITGFGWWTKSRTDPDEQRRAATRTAEIANGVRTPRSAPWEREMLDSCGCKHSILWQECRSQNNLAILCGQDITSRRKVERELDYRTEQLLNREQQLEAIFDCAVEGMFIVSEDGRVIDVNPSGAAILKRSRDEVVGSSIKDLARDPLAASTLLADLEQRGWTRGELQFAHGKGEIAYTECTLKRDMLPGLHLLVMRDQTHRRELEEQLRQAQKMEAIGRLAGGVAHDINNMLTVIHGYSELMIRELPENDALRRHANSILSAVDRCALITQQLLTFSRRQVLQPQSLNLNRVIAEMSKLLQKLLGEDVELCIRLSPGLGNVMADPGQIAQILLNLSANARDAMPRGGWITIETRNATLEQSVATSTCSIEAGDYVTLSITDSGCGMTPEVQSHIFEPFFTTKELGKGTGLGLSTVYGIVRQNHGAIVVSSHPGEGSTFTVYLRRLADPTAQASPNDTTLQESSTCESW